MYIERIDQTEMTRAGSLITTTETAIHASIPIKSIASMLNPAQA
jgi:hypothetical protein